VDDDRFKRRVEIVEAVVLSLSILGTAWCAYQSTLWSGIQTFRLADANGRGRLAMQEQVLADQQRVLDGNIMLHFVEAVIENKPKVVEFYLQRARPELRAALQAWHDTKPWENPNAPLHPGATAEYLALHARTAEPSQRLRVEADQKMEEAGHANQTSDRYVMQTVLFASVLCFVGIASKFETLLVRIGLVSFASLIFLVTVALLLGLPLARG
jgi:hypothetical protein